MLSATMEASPLSEDEAVLLERGAKISTTVVFGMRMKHGKIFGILSKHVMPRKLKSFLSKD